MDERRREIAGGAVFARDNVIERVGTTAELPDTADEVLDLRDRHILLPGLVNTHHHFYQTLTRVIPAAQDGTLFEWLQTLYPLWGKLTAEGLACSSKIAAAELILSGCTTSSDHHYIFPNDCTLDAQIDAVQSVGLRFHACRGSMSVGVSRGGLPPDNLVEAEEHILQDSQRLIEQFHDNSPYAMTRIALAPCSPFSVSRDLMRASADLARSYAGVRLHTHLAENASDIAYSRETFGMTPDEYAESVGWLGPDVWHAHCVQLDDSAIAAFARTGTGVAHCPGSNMRLGSGIAPVRTMLTAGVPVGLGVDGAASNDASNLLHEARLAFLLARVRDREATAMSARTALEVATLGGARVLGRDDIGAIAPGMAADLIAVALDRPGFVGTRADPVAALVFCQVDAVDYSFINGKKVVDSKRLLTLDLDREVATANRLAASLLE